MGRLTTSFLHGATHDHPHATFLAIVINQVFLLYLVRELCPMCHSWILLIQMGFVPRAEKFRSSDIAEAISVCGGHPWRLKTKNLLKFRPWASKKLPHMLIVIDSFL